MSPLPACSCSTNDWSARSARVRAAGRPAPRPSTRPAARRAAGCWPGWENGWFSSGIGQAAGVVGRGQGEEGAVAPGELVQRRAHAGTVPGPDRPVSPPASPVPRPAAGTARGGRRRGWSPAAVAGPRCRCGRPGGPRRAAAPAVPRRSAPGPAGKPSNGSDASPRLGEVLTAGVGERDQLAAGVGGDGDQALVLELADRRVDRAGARGPAAAAALGDGLHQLVAVHRLLGEEQQDGRPDVAARGPPRPPWRRPGTLRRQRPAPAGVVEVVGGIRGAWGTSLCMTLTIHR